MAVRLGWHDGAMTLAIGDPAPDFTLKDQYGQDNSLSSYAGKKAVLLVFYPFAFSGICTSELCSVRDDLAHVMGLAGARSTGEVGPDLIAAV